jgi:hypothetical protein
MIPSDNRNCYSNSKPYQPLIPAWTQSTEPRHDAGEGKRDDIPTGKIKESGEARNWSERKEEKEVYGKLRVIKSWYLFKMWSLPQQTSPKRRNSYQIIQHRIPHRISLCDLDIQGGNERLILFWCYLEKQVHNLPISSKGRYDVGE